MSEMMSKDNLEGGKSDEIKTGFDVDQLCKGLRVEMEHTDEPMIALEIAMDHIVEIPDYYDRLDEMESEALGKVEVELFENNVDQKEVYESWTDGLTYKGSNVYITVYEKNIDHITELIEEKAKDELNDDRPETQEVFLGYIPSKDEFIMGFDGWYTDQYEEISGNFSGCAHFKLEYDKAIVIKNVINEGDIFYGKSGSFKKIKENHPDLVEIRLD